MVICVSLKMRMKTKTAGSRLATIIHAGKGLFSPRGLMTQPRFSGAVTENPLGTLSFCGTEGGAGAGEPWRQCPELHGARRVRPGSRQLWRWGLRRAARAPPYLGVGVLNTVIHEHHDEDGDGHPEVPDHSPHLWASTALSGPTPHSGPDSESAPLPAPSAHLPPTCPPTHPAREEPAILELAQEEGDEEGAGHEHE